MTNLIHIPVNGQMFGRWSAGRGFRDDQTALHALVTGVFGRNGLSSFRFYDGGSVFSIYGYSETPADDLVSRANMAATPDVLAVIGLDGLGAKKMPDIPAGARIGFDVRFCPTRRSDLGERDAWAIESARQDGAGSAEAAYRKWFAERAGAAAEVEAFRVTRKATAETSRKGRKVKLPDVTAQGTFVVTDAEAFSALVRSGIGRHKAYGMGMVLLRPSD